MRKLSDDFSFVIPRELNSKKIVANNETPENKAFLEEIRITKELFIPCFKKWDSICQQLQQIQKEQKGMAPADLQNNDMRKYIKDIEELRKSFTVLENHIANIYTEIYRSVMMVYTPDNEEEKHGK